MSQCSNNLAQIVANDDGTRNPGGVWQNSWPDKGGMTQPSGDLCNTLYTSEGSQQKTPDTNPELLPLHCGALTGTKQKDT